MARFIGATGSSSTLQRLADGLGAFLPDLTHVRLPDAAGGNHGTSLVLVGPDGAIRAEFLPPFNAELLTAANLKERGCANSTGFVSFAVGQATWLQGVTEIHAARAEASPRRAARKPFLDGRPGAVDHAVDSAGSRMGYSRPLRHRKPPLANSRTWMRPRLTVRPGQLRIAGVGLVARHGRTTGRYRSRRT